LIKKSEPPFFFSKKQIFGGCINCALFSENGGTWEGIAVSNFTHKKSIIFGLSKKVFSLQGVNLAL